MGGGWEGAGSLRPRYLTVVCALWVLWGVGTALNGVGDLVDSWLGFQQIRASNAAFGAELPKPIAREIYFILAMNLAIVAVGLAGAVSAVFLLRLKGWARTVLELANWGTLAVITAFAYHLAQLQIMIAAVRMPYRVRDASELGFFDLDSDGAASVFWAVAKVVPFAFPFLFVIKKLRQQQTHDALWSAMARAAQGPAPSTPTGSAAS
jgi:hypothetical protein